MTCTHCRRILVAKSEWTTIAPLERQRLYRTHAKTGGHGYCSRDYQRLRVSGGLDPDVPYVGGWVTVRGIQRPTEPERRAS